MQPAAIGEHYALRMDVYFTYFKRYIWSWQPTLERYNSRTLEREIEIPDCAILELAVKRNEKLEWNGK